MVAAYHETKSSVSSEKDLERRHSKKSLGRSKSLSDQSQPSSPIEEKTVSQDDKTSVTDKDQKTSVTDEDQKTSVTEEDQKTPVTDNQKTSVTIENDSNKVEENALAINANIEHAEKQPETDAEGKETDTLKGNKHASDKSEDKDLSVDVTSGEQEVSRSKNAKSEQKEKKGVFFLEQHSGEVSASESDRKLSLESPEASSSIHPLLMMRNASNNAKENDVNVPAPFAKYVDMNRLHEALTAEKVHLGHEHINQEGLKHALRKKDEKSLKMLIRQNHWGADNEIRASLWQLLCKHLHKAHKDDTFDEFATDIFPPGIYSKSSYNQLIRS